MKTNVELETELKAVEDKISAEYWRFSRTSSPAVKPVSSELYVKKHELQSELKARKSDGVVITRLVQATESEIEIKVKVAAEKIMKKMAKYNWDYERAYNFANLYRDSYRWKK